MPDPIAPPAPLAMKDLITEAGLADRAYLKDYLEKPLDKETGLAILKKLDGAETLIGKKTLIPGDDAKPEDHEAFFGKMRPAKAEDYEIKFGEKPDEDFIKEFRAAAHHAGMSKAQVARQLEKLVPVFQAKEKAVKEANAARETAFETMVKEATGPEFEKKHARVTAALKELAPDAFKKFGDKIDDKSLVLVIAGVSAILDKYASEDEFGGKGGDHSGSGGQDKAALTAELHKLYADPAWSNFQHKDHAAVVAKINDVLAAVNKLPA